MNKLISNIAVVMCLIGVIDQVYDGIATVEMSDPYGNIKHDRIPVWMFPCDVSESDMFYVTLVDGVSELRCGEPPE